MCSWLVGNDKDSHAPSLPSSPQGEIHVPLIKQACVLHFWLPRRAAVAGATFETVACHSEMELGLAHAFDGLRPTLCFLPLRDVVDVDGDSSYE